MRAAVCVYVYMPGCVCVPKCVCVSKCVCAQVLLPAGSAHTDKASLRCGHACVSPDGTAG